MNRTIICIILLLMAYAVCGCDEEAIAWDSSKFSYIHIWCDGCESEIIGTYHTNEGFSFYCSGCFTNYRDRSWNGDKYLSWVKKIYGDEELSRVQKMQNEYEIRYIEPTGHEDVLIPCACGEVHNYKASK